MELEQLAIRANQAEDDNKFLNTTLDEMEERIQLVEVSGRHSACAFIVSIVATARYEVHRRAACVLFGIYQGTPCRDSFTACGCRVVIIRFVLLT